MATQSLLHAAWLVPLAMIGFKFLAKLLLQSSGKIPKVHQVVRKKVFVIDGDTVWTKEGRIRLHGLDAPEISQPFGSHSKAFLISLVKGKVLKVDVHGTDKYGRAIATLYLPDGRNINKLLMEHGWAMAPKGFSTPYHREERQARAKRLGVWSSHERMHPAQWRALSTQQ